MNFVNKGGKPANTDIVYICHFHFIFQVFSSIVKETGSLLLSFNYDKAPRTKRFELSAQDEAHLFSDVYNFSTTFAPKRKQKAKVCL